LIDRRPVGERRCRVTLMGGGSELEELRAELEMLARREEAGEDVPTVPLDVDPDAVPLGDEPPAP